VAEHGGSDPRVEVLARRLFVAEYGMSLDSIRADRQRERLRDAYCQDAREHLAAIDAVASPVPGGSVDETSEPCGYDDWVALPAARLCRALDSRLGRFRSECTQPLGHDTPHSWQEDDRG